jgi:hypothetical protein
MLENDRDSRNHRFGCLEKENNMKIFGTPLVEILGHDSTHFFMTLLRESEDWEDLRSLTRVFHEHDVVRLNPDVTSEINETLSKKDVPRLKDELALAIM